MGPLTGLIVSSILLIIAIIIKKTILVTINDMGTTKDYLAGEYIISKDYAQFERVIDSETVSFIIKGRSFHYKFTPGVKIKMREIEIVLHSLDLENNTVNITINKKDRHN